jgi:hypothetical protein
MLGNDQIVPQQMQRILLADEQMQMQSLNQIHPRRHPGHQGQFLARTAQAMAFLAALFARRQNPATTQFAQGDFGAGERRPAIGRIPGQQGAGFPSQRIARTGRLDCGQLIEMV